MKNTRIIGLTGYAGVGKDTVRAILEQHGYIGLALADPLRSMIEALLDYAGVSLDYMDERALKESVVPELGVSYRHLAQTLGTEWGRCNVAPDFWLRLADAWMNDVRRTTFGECKFVLSDVRFVNEAQWVRQRGGMIWRVEREDVGRVRAHVSESQIYAFDADRTIHNHGTPQELNDVVLAALYGAGVVA